MKKPRCLCVLLLLILVNLVILAYFINDKQSWPQLKTESVNVADSIEKLVTVVLYDFEHFENDVVSTVRSFLAVHPLINIIVVSDEQPYPPIQLPISVKSVVLNVPPFLPAIEGQPERFIKTDYTLFVPDGFHLKDANGLERIVQYLVKSNGLSELVATGAQQQTQAVPECEKINFDYRRWTLKYSSHKLSLETGVDTCNSIEGTAAVLMQTDNVHKLTSVFRRPFLTGLFVQSVLRKWKVSLLKKQSPFLQSKQLYVTAHNRWKHDNNRKHHKKELFRKFGIKRVINKDGSDEWHGCSKETPRCFGTIINDVAAFIYKGRWTPPCCLKNLRETIKHVLTTFEVYKVPYWLEGGSLLGAARNGDVIPWDYDADIGMYTKDITKIPNLKKAHEGEKVVDEDGFVWEKSNMGEFYRVQFSMANHMHIDIFPFYEKNGIMTKNTWFKTHRQDTEFPVRFLQPLERMKFVGMDVLVPNNYKEFLEFKFGKGVIENPKYPDLKAVQKSSSKL